MAPIKHDEESENEFERRSGMERRISVVETAIARFGSDINDIKSKQEVQKQLNEIQFRGIQITLDKISAQISESDKKVDGLELLSASVKGGINLIKFVGFAGLIGIITWIIIAVKMVGSKP